MPTSHFITNFVTHLARPCNWHSGQSAATLRHRCGQVRNQAVFERRAHYSGCPVVQMPPARVRVMRAASGTSEADTSLAPSALR